MIIGETHLDWVVWQACYDLATVENPASLFRRGHGIMASLTCPECRKEMLPQKGYDQLICARCGQDIYKPGQNLRKIYCTDCDETGSERKVRVLNY